MKFDPSVRHFLKRFNGDLMADQIKTKSDFGPFAIDGFNNEEIMKIVQFLDDMLKRPITDRELLDF